jgi:hypothetical protein
MMRSTAHHDVFVTVRVHRSRMRAFAQLVGGVVLGLGLAAAVGLNPGLIFAGYTIGIGALLLCLGLLLPEDSGAAAHPDDRSRPPQR